MWKLMEWVFNAQHCSYRVLGKQTQLLHEQLPGRWVGREQEIKVSCGWCNWVWRILMIACLFFILLHTLTKRFICDTLSTLKTSHLLFKQCLLNLPLHGFKALDRILELLKSKQFSKHTPILGDFLYSIIWLNSLLNYIFCRFKLPKWRSAFCTVRSKMLEKYWNLWKWNKLIKYPPCVHC